jgi:hypothetical protein
VVLVRLVTQNPQARRALLAAIDGSFQEGLRVEVLGHVQLGDTIYYKLRAKWRCCRSALYMTYEELKALYVEIMAAAKQGAEGGDSLEVPPLPPKTDRAAIFGTGNRARVLPNKDGSLQEWFRQVGERVAGAPPHVQNVLLGALEVQPKALY